MGRFRLECDVLECGVLECAVGVGAPPYPHLRFAAVAVLSPQRVSGPRFVSPPGLSGGKVPLGRRLSGRGVLWCPSRLRCWGRCPPTATLASLRWRYFPPRGGLTIPWSWLVPIEMSLGCWGRCPRCPCGLLSGLVLCCSGLGWGWFLVLVNGYGVWTDIGGVVVEPVFWCLLPF